MRTINVLKPKYRTNEVLDEIKICLDKGWTGMGFKTVEFDFGDIIRSGLVRNYLIAKTNFGAANPCQQP